MNQIFLRHHCVSIGSHLGCQRHQQICFLIKTCLDNCTEHCRDIISCSRCRRRLEAEQKKAAVAMKAEQNEKLRRRMQREERRRLKKLKMVSLDF